MSYIPSKINNSKNDFFTADLTIENEKAIIKYESGSFSKEYTLDFTGFKYDETNKVATPYMIPPGEYDLCLGFEQKMGHDVEVSFNGEYIGTVTASQLTKTDFHYDRGGQGYPESYDISKATNKKKSNYDRDGGRVAVIKIGGTEPVKINIKFHGINATKCCFHHWCLKPTKNCY